MARLPSGAEVFPSRIVALHDIEFEAAFRLDSRHEVFT